MNKRNQSIGIKQTIRLEWMQYTARLLSEGESGKNIRNELNNFLRYRKAESSNTMRGEESRVKAVSILSSAWVDTAPELTALRDEWLAFARANDFAEQSAHWGIISAAYPFWFNTAQYVGRLLSLQDKITHSQIVNRLKEQYGDREVVSRCARCVIRSFVAWGVIMDTNKKGSYAKVSTKMPLNEKSAALMIESVLHATPEGKCQMDLLGNHPGLFPFSIPFITADMITKSNPRIQLIRHSVKDELLQLKSA